MRLSGVISMDRFQLLVFSFYREENVIQTELEPLLRCTMNLEGPAICIDCIDEKHRKKVASVVISSVG